MTIERTTNIPKTNRADFNEDGAPVNGATVKKPLKTDQNSVVNKQLWEKAAGQVQVMDFSIPKSSEAEQGHAAPPTPEQKAYQQALAKYEAALDKHNAALEQNKAIDVENKPLAQKAEFFDKMRESLLKVASHGLAGDSYISKQELTDLLASSDAGQRVAAEFLLANWDAIPAPKYSDWGGGMNANEMRQWATTCGKEAESWRKQMKPHVSVPQHPGSPPPPPGSAQSSSSASTGRTDSPNQPRATEGTKEPSPGTKETAAQAEARILSNYKGVGPFSSNATTAEGRMQDAMAHVQKGIDALQLDLVAASTKDPVNQAEVMMIQNKMQQIQNALSALMQMMKQQQETNSNMSKMFSDMAMSAIRNMR